MVGVESYCRVPLLNSSSTVVGHLAILSERPMWDGPRGLAIMRIFAKRRRKLLSDELLLVVAVGLTVGALGLWLILRVSN